MASFQSIFIVGLVIFVGNYSIIENLLYDLWAFHNGGGTSPSSFLGATVDSLPLSRRKRYSIKIQRNPNPSGKKSVA
ncbi:hypothetical protein F4824DRAFT_451457 [Ustulina deusta]|nr:hypothetical protein F4824DRAFT_451457 [Ustulina deusta]